MSEQLFLSAIPDLTPYVTKHGVYPAAHGGFADIWMCTLSNDAYPSITQHVAVKVLRSLAGGFSDEDKHEKRLRRELAVWLKLKHPRVLPLYGIVSGFGPYPSMVCPWMDKGNLNNYLAGDGKSLAVEGRYRIKRPTLEAVAEYLENPDGIFGFAPPALPHLTNITPDSFPNESHGEKMESWTAQYKGNIVAVKVFRLPWTSLEKAAALRDMGNIRGVEHPHLLAYVATAEYDGLPGVVMPWISSQNLCVYLPNAFVPISRKLILWNVLITDEGDAKLCNFGIMPILYRHIQSSQIFETYDEDCRWADPILWLKPVDGQARPSETFATDVYAFGRVVYQIVTNEEPLHNLWDDMDKFRSLSGASNTLASLRPPQLKTQVGTDDSIRELIDGCWEVDHRKRPTMQTILAKVHTIVAPAWTVRMGHHSIPFERRTVRRDDDPQGELFSLVPT
ncbi:hypothetical protein EYR38_006132 [Pleurotus pulmonarius]|nr:hypothetical protein EYR38_006132 [Pleurotus pulmonarius]